LGGSAGNIASPAVCVGCGEVSASPTAIRGGGRAGARAGSANSTSRASRAVIDQSAAVIVLAVAHLGHARVDGHGAVVAIISAARDGRMLVAVLVERVEEADRGLRVALDVGLAGVALEGFGALLIRGAGGIGYAAFLHRAVLPGGAGGHAGVRPDRVRALAVQAGVDGAIETVVAACGATSASAARTAQAAATRVRTAGRGRTRSSVAGGSTGAAGRGIRGPSAAAGQRDDT